MTEVPEHLLQRSRDRRAALGLGGGDGGAGGGESAAPASAAASSEGAIEPAAAAPAAAAAAPAEVEVKAPEPVPAYVEASLKRTRIPIWAMPVLAFLPVWAILYAGSLSPASTGELTPLAEGAELFTTKCAGCHGATGGGGTGRQLSDGEVLKTFPNIEQQLEFVATGTEAWGKDNPYGDPNREGGQRIAGSFGIMPSFADLTQEELLAIVRHERETLSGEAEGFEVDEEGHRLDADGNPLISEEGELILPDGSPLLDETGRLTIQIAGTEGGSVGGQPNDLDAQP